MRAYRTSSRSGAASQLDLSHTFTAEDAAVASVAVDMDHRTTAGTVSRIFLRLSTSFCVSSSDGATFVSGSRSPKMA